MKINRLINYEYWPYYIFYIPMYFYGLVLAAKAKSFTYYTTTNPSMKHGGIMGESKFKVLKFFPKEMIPKSILIKSKTSNELIKEKLEEAKISFPFIAKPDVGERGKKVEKIDNDKELNNYYKESSSDFIIQEYIPYSFEAGVLYYRFPGDKKGSISSVVTKDFLHVKGDGKSTIKSLIERNIRAHSRKKYLYEKFSCRINEVLEKDQKLYLEPIGNHSRGTAFINSNHLINDQMIDLFDHIARQIPGFYYGRFDIKASSERDLYTGENLKILELNGVSSEPGHIYDPNYKQIKAYKDLAFHMNVIYKISKLNYKKGNRRTSLKTFLTDLQFHLRTN